MKNTLVCVDDISIDDTGCVILHDAELEALVMEAIDAVAGGVNNGCTGMNPWCTNLHCGGTNTRCVNTDCGGSTNTGCSNSEISIDL